MNHETYDTPGQQMPAELRLPLKVRRDGRIPYSVKYRGLNAQGKRYPTTYTFYAIAGNEASVAEASQAADELIALMNTPGISPEAALAAHPKVEGDTVEPRQLKGPLLADWALACIDDNPNDAQPDTLAKDRTYVNDNMVPFFGADKHLADVTDTDINNFVKWLKRTKKNGPSTIHKKVNVLGRALRAGVKERKITYNPMLDAAPLPTIEEVEKTLLTEEEFLAIRDAFHQEGYQLLMEFLIMSGCRFSETTALKYDDFDLVNGTVRIRRAWKYGEHDGPGTKKYYKEGPPKTAKSKRTVRLPFQLIARLIEGGLLKPDREWVFTNSFGGPVRQHSFINNVWNPTIERVNLGSGRQRVKIKDMRDAYVSWQLEDGTDPKTVQKMAGHANLATTTGIYARNNPRNEAPAAERHGLRIYKMA